MATPAPAWIFFDVGWTLVDETAANMAYYEQALAAAPAAGDATVRSLFARHAELIAAGEPDPFTRVLESIGLSGNDRRRFDSGQDRERAYRDTEPALRALASVVKMGVLANQPTGLNERLTRVGLRRYFQVILGSAESGFKKPDPKFFELAASRAGCPPAQLMMAGDRLDNDIAPARALGWQTAWIRRSKLPRPRNEQETPDVEVTKLIHLAARYVSADTLRLAELTDAEGFVTAWPDKVADKHLVLDFLAGKFEAGRAYAEREVNELIDRHHRFGDYAMLRRALVDRRLLARDAAGRRYRRA